MKLFGITGGIGMGKSAAVQILRERNLPVVDTDVLARQIVEKGEPALREIEQAFGSKVLASDGRLNRGELAKIVFSDVAARQKLEGITHPRIRALWKKQAELWRSEQRPFAAVVIPLLFETGAESEFDAIICVACSVATQHRRLLYRGWTSQQIEQRLAAQWPVEKKIAKADFVVWSEDGLDILAAQLDRILTRE
jgi:dephospho-CoA kinase